MDIAIFVNTILIEFTIAFDLGNTPLETIIASFYLNFVLLLI